jgi:hypothetical protein
MQHEAAGGLSTKAFSFGPRASADGKNRYAPSVTRKSKVAACGLLNQVTDFDLHCGREARLVRL